MTQGDLDRLRESCYFATGVQFRLPKDDETIMSTRLSDVAFYESIFHVSLRLLIYPTIRSILYFNIYPAQFAPNVW